MARDTEGDNQGEGGDAGDRQSFSSFKDLLGRFGGDDEEGDEGDAAPAESVDPKATTEIVARPEADVYGGSIREIIDGREDGFGPMDHGPAFYADLESEEMELLSSFRVRTVFPADVLREVGELPRDPRAADYVGVPDRLDLRGERIFTIDGDDAKDFDDAICIKPLDSGCELSVHIADVSHYVRPGTALNAEALARATSVYLPDQVVPMLPEELSNHLCSLVPDRDRLVFSVFMQFDERGQRTGYSISKSVIRSMRRCTYRQVQKLLDGEDDDDTRRIAELRPDLELFAAWTKTQQKLRDRRGSLRMQSGERKFRFGQDGQVTGIYESETFFSQTLIEETALAANQAVGDFFKVHGLPTIYRVHPEKDPEEVAEVIKNLEQYGVRVPRKERLTGRDIGAMVRFARSLPNAGAMIARIMGLLERASYEVQDHEDQAEHFGLAREHYLHFTSPIRRYPDLIVHRMLYDVLSRGDEAKEAILDREQINELIEVAGHSSLQADVAQMAETAVGDLKLCQYMEPHTGKRFPARVGRVSRAGLDIELEGEYVSGFLPTSTIGSQVKLEGPVIKIRTRQGTRVFREGDRVDVVVKDVDFVRLKVIFELAQGRRS